MGSISSGPAILSVSLNPSWSALYDVVNVVSSTDRTQTAKRKPYLERLSEGLPNTGDLGVVQGVEHPSGGLTPGDSVPGS